MTEHTTKSLEIGIALVYTPFDDAIGGESKLLSRKDAIGYVVTTVMKEMERKIPEGSAVTVVFGFDKSQPS